MKISARLLTFLLIAQILCFAVACNDQPTGLSDTIESSQMVSLTESDTSQGVSSEVIQNSGINYQLIALGDRLFLIPAMLEDYYNAVSSGIDNFVMCYDEQNQQFKPIGWNISKCHSVQGQFFTGDIATFDIYRCELDNNTYYHIRNSQAPNDEMERRLLEDLITGKTTFQPQSKDYTIMQIFEDLYAIDVRGNLKRITGREIEEFDYNTISKEGLGDLFRWQWSYQPVFCPQNNRIFYLSSREGQFYSIWQIDMDRNTEERFGEDVALELLGATSDRIIAVMDPDRFECYAKSISVSDPAVYTELTDRSWQSFSGYLFKIDGNTTIIKTSEQQLEIKSDCAYQPLLLDGSILWFSYQSGINEVHMIRVDLDEKKVSCVTTASMDRLSNWQDVFKDINSSGITFGQAAQQKLDITIDQHSLMNSN